MKFKKLRNLDTAYIEIIALNSSPIYNVATRLCLNINLDSVACDTCERNDFILFDSQIAISSGNKTECLGHLITAPNWFRFDRTACGSSLNFQWDSVSFHISGVADNKSSTFRKSQTGCLAIYDDGKIYFKECNDLDIKKWIFGPGYLCVGSKR
jgi:hypothetical protein